jgi:cell division protein FtsN
MAKNVEISPVGKTIRDFESIPEVYFENVPGGEVLTVRQNQAFLMSKKIDSQRKLDVVGAELSASTSLVRNKYYVQLGSFKNKSKADKLLDSYKDVGKTHQVVDNKNGNSTLYRVIIGTFNTNLEATNAKNKLIDKGHTDVFVFKN